MEPNDKTDSAAGLSPVKRAFLALQKVQARCDALETARHAPIAIVGMACRFPGGADDVDTYWRMLADGVDGVGELPAHRRAILAGGKLSDEDAVPVGGFLTSPIDQFDSQFFGIAPREAECIDPQQRLLLEVSWEALEHAGQIEDRLAPSRSGVFVGITSHDYSQVLDEAEDMERLDQYFITGSSLNAAAGRLSYTLGFNGPSMAIDTACSSSLVAIHQACRSLLDGDCDRALAGGVNLILSPLATMALGRGGVLAADGHCKAFDADADGMVRGEGCAVVVLKRLSDAQDDGDNILAVIRGSAVNQDGASSGLTVPNGPSQEAVVREALKAALLQPDDIDYVEAHGTGTSLGDPIEAHALGNVFGRRDRPLLLGSVKANIAHLEAASGIAGILKVVLALTHQQVPRQLHFQTPSPHIRWQETSLHVPTAACPWPAQDRPRIAGVSSFGFSGTNAHVIIAEAPSLSSSRSVACNGENGQAESGIERPLHVLALSAKTQAALVELAARYDRHFSEGPGDDPGDVCFTANSGRGHWRHRLAVVGVSQADMRDGLSRFTTSGTGGDSTGSPPKLAMKFAGGDFDLQELRRWVSELHESQPTFRAILQQCQDLLSSDLDQPLLDVLFDEQGALLEQSEYALPAVTAAQYALGRLWMSWGIAPSMIVGEGAGEYAGACIAGVLSLRDALLLSARSAGPPDSLTACAREMSFEAPQLPFVGRSGSAGDPAVLTSRYWSEAAVEGETDICLDELRRRNCQLVLSVGADANSNRLLQCDKTSDSNNGVRLTSFGWRALLDNIAELYRRGVAVDWRGFDRGYQRRRVVLPSYPFQRERYWLDAKPESKRSVPESPVRSSGHPLLGGRLSLAGSKEIRFECQLNSEHPAFLRDHRVFGHIIFPATALLEMALAAGSEVLGTEQLELRDIVVERALLLPEDSTATCLQTVLTPLGGGAFSWRIFSRSGSDPSEAESWTSHAAGRLARVEPMAKSPQKVDLEELRGGVEPRPTKELYERCLQRGIDFGESFRSLQTIWRNSDSVLGQVCLPEVIAASTHQYRFHPALLDGGLHILAGLELDGDGDDPLLMPVAIDRYCFLRPPGAEVWAHMNVGRLKGAISSSSAGHAAESLTVDIEMVSPEGLPIAILEGLQLKSATRESVSRLNQSSMRNWLYCMQWRFAEPVEPLPDSDSDGGKIFQAQGWLIVSASAKSGSRSQLLAQHLENRGATCTLVSPGENFQNVGEGCFELDPLQPEHFHCLLNELAGHRPGPLRVVFVGESVENGSGPLEDHVFRECASLLHLVQAMAKADQSAQRKLWTLCCGAQSVVDGDVVPGFRQASLWGLMKTIQLEHAELDCRYVDLEPGEGDAQLDLLCAELAADSDERHVAFRAGQRYFARVVPLTDSPSAEVTGDTLFRADASYLITGGLRGLGLEVANWMAERGAGRLVLIARSMPDENARQRIAEMQQRGTVVETVRTDISDAGQVAALMERVADGSPLRGVIHSAMVLDDGVLAKQTAERFQRVLAPKVAGAWNLHEQTQELPLDFFVLFSSAASLLGAAGQGSYCAANAFMDSLAEHRRSTGLQGLSINWGPWADTGVVARSGEDGENVVDDLAVRMRSRGLELIPLAKGLEVLGRLLSFELGQVAVVPGVWSEMIGQSHQEMPSLLRDLAIADANEANGDSDGELRVAIRKASGDQRRSLLLEFLRGNVAAVLRSRPDQVELGEPLNMMGLDSLMAVELRNRVNKQLGIDVPVVKFMEGHTVLELADEIEHRFLIDAPAEGVNGHQPPPAREMGATAVKELEPLEAQDLLARLGDLTDEEVDALLASSREQFTVEDSE